MLNVSLATSSSQLSDPAYSEFRDKELAMIGWAAFLQIRGGHSIKYLYLRENKIKSISLRPSILLNLIRNFSTRIKKLIINRLRVALR